MTKLSVNINKLATLRNARGKNNPDVLAMALDIINYGADGITVHPRPDGRHIRKDDVYKISKNISVEFNIEGYPDKDFLNLIKEVKPAQCTLVPDPPHVLTSNAGWNVAKNIEFLRNVVSELHDYQVRVSLFIDPQAVNRKELELLKEIGTDRIELYTESYAETYGTQDGNKILAIYKQIAKDANELGIDLNAGHDLNLDNLRHFINEIPTIKEVSIGHALICDALHFGLKETISRYLACLQ